MAQTNTKRKLENDSDDELFFSLENEKTKKRLSNEDPVEEVNSKVTSPTSTEDPKSKTSTDAASSKTENKENNVLNSVGTTSDKIVSVSPAAAAAPASALPLSSDKLKQSKLSFFKSSPAPKKNVEPEKKTTTDEPKQIVTDPESKNCAPSTITHAETEKETAAATAAAAAATPTAAVIQRPDGDWMIEDYLLDPEWKSLLKDQFEKPYFISINKMIKTGYNKNIVRPPKELVFNALNSIKLQNIRVVIIGQDPYHDDGQAHGLAFSVPKGVRVPPSLKNIFNELKDDIPGFQRDEKLGGYLQKWANDGVFLLNTFLTVEAHKAGSHSKIGWEIFTDRVIKLISEHNSGCAFMLWGNFAQNKENLIDKKRHKVLKCGHPSPLSVRRFYGSKCFSQANAFLESLGKKPIDWSLTQTSA